MLAEQKAGKLQPGTANAVTAAAQFGAPISVLVSGSNVGSAADEAAKLAGVKQVLELAGAVLLSVHSMADEHALTVRSNFYPHCCSAGAGR